MYNERTIESEVILKLGMQIYDLNKEKRKMEKTIKELKEEIKKLRSDAEMSHIIN